MCFSKAASKIPKGEQMPKVTVLVYFRPDHQGALHCNQKPGTAQETSLQLRGALLKEAGGRHLLSPDSFPSDFFSLIHCKMY